MQCEYLSGDIVDQPLHAGLHTERMLAWQKLGIPVAVQADGTRQQLIKLFHFFLVERSRTTVLRRFLSKLENGERKMMSA